MNFTIPVFERRAGGSFSCVTLGLGPFTKQRSGRNLHKIHTGIADELRADLLKAKVPQIRRFQMAKGLRIERVRLELSLVSEGERRKVSGVYPIVIEPRWASADERIHLAYHPRRQEDAIPVDPDRPLDDQIRAHLARAWADLPDEVLRELPCDGRERIDVLSFSSDTRTLLDELPDRRDRDDDGDGEAPRKKRRGLTTLRQIGVNLGQSAAQGDLDVGVPRSPYRERIQLLLAAGKSRPLIVVGPPGAGKTTIIHRAVADVLEIDGYPAHRNLDRVRPVFRISGRRVIAGMSRLGDWEKRCVSIVEEARDRDAILVVEDLAHFGSIGRSRESDRSLADFFRGPLSRREIVMIGECTDDALRRLQQDAPAFASLFAPLYLPETTSAETLRLLVREMRGLERAHRVRVTPSGLRAVIEMSGSLLAGRAFPGKAIDLLREACRALDQTSRGQVQPGFRPLLGEGHVIELLAEKTGIPRSILRSDEALAPSAIEAALAAQVMGQDEAVKVAVDLVCRVKAGLTDPRRPYGVFLFTGPTGTGKTELAKCLAEYLYGSPARMIRLDMGEFSGPDAPARLIGHRFHPEGLLTQRVIEQPFSLVLLDEIEKAHPSVLSLLLQLFEDGRLTDAGGRTAHFQHAVVIMTSNLGARPRPAVGFGESADAILHDTARAVREFFPPELWNRIDRVVPFRPIDPAVAGRVAQKELDRLCRRRGLSERSIFVDVGPGVADRVAREAFVARDGARSIKRFIEDRIGSKLATAITEGEPAAMSILRLTMDGDAFAVAREALVEALPADARWALAPMLHEPAARLRERLPALLGFVDGLEAEGRVAHLSDRIRFHLAQQGRRDHADAVYNLDAVRAALSDFRARVEALIQRPEDAHEQIEMERFGWIPVQHEWRSEQRVRIFKPSLAARDKPLLRAEILETLAEGYWLRRAFGLVDDPTQHAVFVDLSRAADLGDAARFEDRPPGLLEAMASAYAGVRGEIDAFIAVAGDETVAAHGELLAARAGVRTDRCVLRVVGLGVRDLLGLEDGAHVWTSLARGPEVVRVRVYPALPGEDPVDALQRPLPAALPPVVRKVRFEPRADGGPVSFEIEDYVMGYAETVTGRTLADALAPLWILRESREDEEAAS